MLFRSSDALEKRILESLELNQQIILTQFLKVLLLQALEFMPHRKRLDVLLLRILSLKKMVKLKLDLDSQ